jgi:hypothetical protein
MFISGPLTEDVVGVCMENPWEDAWDKGVSEHGVYYLSYQNRVSSSIVIPIKLRITTNVFSIPRIRILRTTSIYAVTYKLVVANVQICQSYFTNNNWTPFSCWDVQDGYNPNDIEPPWEFTFTPCSGDSCDLQSSVTGKRAYPLGSKAVIETKRLRDELWTEWSKGWEIRNNEHFGPPPTARLTGNTFSYEAIEAFSENSVITSPVEWNQTDGSYGFFSQTVYLPDRGSTIDYKIWVQLDDGLPRRIQHVIQSHRWYELSISNEFTQNNLLIKNELDETIDTIYNIAPGWSFVCANEDPKCTLQPNGKEYPIDSSISMVETEHLADESWTGQEIAYINGETITTTLDPISYLQIGRTTSLPYDDVPTFEDGYRVEYKRVTGRSQWLERKKYLNGTLLFHATYTPNRGTETTKVFLSIIDKDGLPIERIETVSEWSFNCTETGCECCYALVEYAQSITNRMEAIYGNV